MSTTLEPVREARIPVRDKGVHARASRPRGSPKGSRSGAYRTAVRGQTAGRQSGSSGSVKRGQPSVPSKVNSRGDRPTEWGRTSGNRQRRGRNHTFRPVDRLRTRDAPGAVARPRGNRRSHFRRRAVGQLHPAGANLAGLLAENRPGTCHTGVTGPGPAKRQAAQMPSTATFSYRWGETVHPSG